MSENPNANARPQASQAGARPAAAAALFLVWVALSGKFDGFHLGVGALVALFLAWRARKLPALSRPGLDAPEAGLRLARLIPYLLWLGWQMFLSAIYVAGVILRPGKHLNPRFFAFRSDQPSIQAATVLANSITLTPGTLTIELYGNDYLVHAISQRTQEDFLEGTMPAKVAALFAVPNINLPQQLDSESAGKWQ